MVSEGDGGREGERERGERERPVIFIIYSFDKWREMGTPLQNSSVRKIKNSNVPSLRP